jgi:hypothetical protein
MIDQRPSGGFLGPDAARPKTRKMKWTPENDRSLLLFGFGRDISGAEYQAIANWFKEKPTAKAVQERLTKLRAAGRKVLKESGIFDADAPRGTPAVSRAPSVVQTSAASQRLTTPATPTTPTPGPSSLRGQSVSQPPVSAAFVLSRSPTPTPSTGAQIQPSSLAPFTGMGMNDSMSYSSSASRGVGRGSSGPFPHVPTMQRQQELMRSYGQQYSSLTATGQSQQHAGNAIGTADDNTSRTAEETANVDGGVTIDELRRSQMELETQRARLDTRKNLE